MIRSFLALWPAIVFLTGSPNAETRQIPGSEFGFGNWQGAAYYQIESGSFTHCGVSAGYKSGDTLLFSVTSGATVNVAVASPNIPFRAGHEIPVSIIVDNRQPFYGRAIVRSDGMAALEIFDTDRALTAFRKGYTMVVEGGGLRGVYDLKGTYRALDLVRSCAVYFTRNHVPFASTETVDGTAQSIDPALLYQLATAMISDLGVRDARFLTGEELAAIQLGGAVYWTSAATGISGGVMFFDRPSDFDVRDADATTSSYLARECQGDFATSARSIEADFPVRQVRLVCSRDQGGYEVLATNSLLSGLHMVTILKVDSASDVPTKRSVEQISEEHAIQSAAFYIEHR